MQTPSFLTHTLVLILICALNTNNYFLYHAPGAIADSYKSWYSISTPQFGSLFTIYSLPNIVLTFYTGRAIDVWGMQRCSLLFNSSIFFGVLIIALTPHSSPFAFYGLLLGRLFLGLGGESVVASAQTMIGKWFGNPGRKSEIGLNTAMAVNQSFVQLFGSAAAFATLPLSPSVEVSNWICLAVAAASLIANLLYGIFDENYKDFLREDPPPDAKLVSPTSYGALPPIENISEPPPPHDSFSIKNFGVRFWVVVVMQSLLSPILYTFTAFGPLYLMQRFHITQKSAGMSTSLLYISLLAAPVFGLIIDRTGHRALTQVIASVNIPLAIICIHFNLLRPWVGMVSLGLAFSVTESNGFAMLFEAVDAKLLGTGYGILSCGISLALLLEPLSVGALRDATGSFDSAILLFIGVSTLGVLAAVASYLVRNLK